ncbi:hypothetical protein D3870_02485 [Noviherbaspirillum cavernae]|uniref:Uncharacterized protein n=1 Tax=Noviherbaspirillum cavernae TaxID=2320862 RepID=A0A418WY35_9BURK|nr:hypothetical protein [Noviherbaspirillum cavernae]RJG05033.1 hypothetical protein D3870_02485 [Noviherbaspirillum cavernae]
MNRLNYKQLNWLVLWLWLGFVVGMSVFVTRDIAALQGAQAFADFMSQFIPMLDNIGKIPGATEWVRFYYAVFWAVSPVFAYVGWLLRKQQCVEGKYLRHLSDIKLVIFTLVLAGFIGLALIWPVADGSSWRDQGVVSNIFGIAHFTFVCVGMIFIVGLYIRIWYSRIKFGSTIEPTNRLREA